MTHKSVFAGSLDTISANGPTTLDLRETMNNASRKQLGQTQDLREANTGFPSDIFKQSTGSMNTTSMKTQHLQSLITMVSLMRTSLVAATSVDVKFKDASHPNGVIGLVAGCYKGAAEGWAGQANREWWSGVVVKREVSNGMYEPQFVSQATLKEMYGKAQ